ncbi:NAD(P)-dependent oxidoreductase [Paenibacillus sp. H1-7]|uniref:NAD-dependent epimerase/dehydratase family protein n=1 Tax=Paenibacillus sp. H1-7 TaxID=2282849 RepID=UPI001EF79558|nr:NAD(P)-dependent oxidoreductase [Paenibacillus sp. H1-7]ULL19031.1 NAD(P)-dependent oxidoreductase [Paenibacillus sp. H1-7]
MKALIGYTGFVGSNLLKQASFDCLYNSKNIEEIKGNKFSQVFCAGAPAVKWKANQDPYSDWNSITSLINNLKEIECERFILVSTVDVYKDPNNVTEDSEVDESLLDAYGKHRFYLEQFVEDKFPKTNIVRLPGLFGDGLKKNIIYDFLHNNCIDMINCENVFQFYNLDRIYRDIMLIIQNDIARVNFGTEPVSVKEVASFAFNINFNNTTEKMPVYYDMRTKYSTLFNSNSPGYIDSKENILNQIKEFVERFN